MTNDVIQPVVGGSELFYEQLFFILKVDSWLSTLIWSVGITKFTPTKNENVKSFARLSLQKLKLINYIQNSEILKGI